MSLRVAFDLDGVLADMNGALASHADNPQASRPSSWQAQDVWRAVSDIENYWESLNETESGIVSRLNELATTRHWEVIFLTRRPSTKGFTAQVQSQRWLEKKGFARPSVYVVQRSRGKLADALGVQAVVDDDVQNCLEVSRHSTARAILICRDTTPQTDALRRLGICCLESVDAALQALVAMEPSKTK